MNNENLGPAERIIQTLLTYNDHAVHNRSGIVIPDARQTVGVRWEPTTYKVENGEKVVYRLVKAGKKTTKVRTGVMDANYKVTNNGVLVGEYRNPGLFPEVLKWMYRQIADVWAIDNEFAARWASYAFAQEHRDLKVVLAAFMLVQSRKGDPVMDAGKVAFHDEDYRDIGEAMLLLQTKDKKDFNPKLLLRVYDVLNTPEVAAINRELGFGKSARRPFFGRWEKAVEKWLRYREENPKLLEGLVKAGFRTTVMELARKVGYKPISGKFFETLRWKQQQADTGHRTIAIGEAVKAAETWDNLTEEQICRKIVKDKPNYKRIVGLVPVSVGITRAIMAAAIEAGSLSSKDLIIATPTLEELGLLQVQDVRERWEKAVKEADDMRAANIATRVKSKETQEKLVEASDNALKKAVEEVSKDMRFYFFIDRSGSMENSIQKAKTHIARFLQAFPLDRVHVCAFNSIGKEIEIKHASAVGVENAFRGITATGGTTHASGVRCLSKYKPQANEDTVFFFVGDEEESGTFEAEVRASGLNPLAFAFVKIDAVTGAAAWRQQQNFNRSCVRDTANRLGVPCFLVDENTFADPYAIPRTVRNLIASTPVTQQTTAIPRNARKTLVETILESKLLVKPQWAISC